ncbi:MAG TPA: hypothetical protein VFE60_07330 [Roseiarcus sp.]|nr:hypothetical protein [Roseiarcus sp.]
MSGKKNPHWGASLDEFLDTEGIREAAKAAASTRVVAWQLNQEIERQGITKAVLAERMHTSRAQVTALGERQWTRLDKLCGNALKLLC